MSANYPNNCLSLRGSQGATRRNFLKGMGAIGATALFPVPAPAQTLAEPRRIDIHHHFSSPGFVAEVTKRNVGNPRMRMWTLEVSLGELDESGTATAVLSLTRAGNLVWRRRVGPPVGARIE